MRFLKKILATVVAAGLIASVLPVVAFADTPQIIEEITYVNGVEVGRTYRTADGTPVYYNGSQWVPCTQAQVANAQAAGNGGKWVPNWGPNYEAERQRMVNGSRNTNPQPQWKPNWGYPYQPYPCPQPVDKKKTVADEATAQANDISRYADDRGWSCKIENIQDSDTLARRKLKFGNSKYTMTLEQVTEVLWAGGYDTKYKFNDQTWTKDQVKWTLDNYK